jgi:uncharacterized sulfatase
MKKLTWFLVFVLLMRVVVEAQDPPQPPPNFLFILADDLGWSDLGCYGNTFHETPYIDRLAQQGMRFTNAYAASPVCSPTRASIQTGLYPARIGMNMIINPHRRPWAELSPPNNRWNLPDNTPTLAEALLPSGYVSTLIGKWNLGYDNPDMPVDRGYQAPPHEGLDSLNERYREAVVSFAQENSNKGTGKITQLAVKFLEEHRDTPFLCFVSYHSVHIPMEARASSIQKFAEKKKTQTTNIHPKYAAMVADTDESVGLLLQVLDSLKLSDNTLVVFFSDNGGLIQVYHQCGPIITTNAPLRGEKGTLYEGGIRVPMIVRWPGQIPAGALCDEPVISQDFFPTLLELSGARTEQRSDAKSLVPLLTQRGGFQRSALYWHYPAYHHSTPAAAIRVGDYKLIEFFETGEIELYYLKEDISEQQNIATQVPEVVQELRKKLADWQQEIKAGMPAPNPNYNLSKAYIWGERPEKPWLAVNTRPLPMQEKCQLLDEDEEILNQETIE